MKTRTKIILWVVLFVVVFVLSALLRVSYLGSAPMKILSVKWDKTVGTEYRNLDYENDCDHKYDLYVPADVHADKTYSLILYIHGGSFNSGAKEDGDAWCKFFTSKGYVTATLDYSLQMVHADASLPAMDRQIENCVSAIYSKCKSLGVNVVEMATSGVSAGGTLAMNYAFIHAEDSPIPVKFVFQLVAPADFEPADWDILKKVNKLKSDAEFVAMMTGVDISDEMISDGEYAHYIESISPARLVSSNSPPVLCGYGLKDHLVPAQLKFKLLQAFDDNGVTYDYFEFPHSNHGMYGDLDILQNFVDKASEYYDKYFTSK